MTETDLNMYRFCDTKTAYFDVGIKFAKFFNSCFPCLSMIGLWFVQFCLFFFLLFYDFLCLWLELQMN